MGLVGVRVSLGAGLSIIGVGVVGLLDFFGLVGLPD